MNDASSKPWTMQQIAAAAGVSVTTVSHTLSGKRPVSSETALRIRGLIDQFGYVPDAGARRLKSGRSGMIGLAVPDISHWYFGRIARGVEELANERDYGLIICSTSNSDPRREKRYFNLLRTRSIEGLVYTASREISPTDELMRMASSSSPIVLADEEVVGLPGVPSVTSLNFAGAQALGRHLRALGHTRAVIVAGFAGLRSTVERVAGIRESFPDAIVVHGDFELQSGYDLVDELLAQGVGFTALFGCNDYMAVGAMRRLHEAGLRVPHDVSVVGFDDVDIAGVITPGLTTVRQDMLEIGRRSAQLLIEGLDAGSMRGIPSVTLPVELVVRGSTGPVAGE
ncbi:LacI family DNA-binding transcriptional regulator [Herbiconiux daphne]|uniref:LacI family transcriptional regulator n=1 Tax=Herbiconiux daphne TaxID=2970914 RepID=A0ABT2GZ37_9MICO|nr:LacI family DNA-binding transcriptional regulator [Herbiconiux daphne]MCS5732325.1 LacI family transcriptional regulator [Herbiconiux daphne]